MCGVSRSDDKVIFWLELNRMICRMSTIRFLALSLSDYIIVHRNLPRRPNKAIAAVCSQIIIMRPATEGGGDKLERPGVHVHSDTRLKFSELLQTAH